jgi:Asp-tRNA(Asn)/Glu-tRNA(Gln) amidotransferase A subunit family amidase
MIEVTELSIAELRAALESGRTTAVELVKAYLARIAAYDGPATETRLNAVVVPNPEAMREAEASDARRARGETLGPLDGIPYTAKDSYLVKGLTAASGSPAFKDWCPSTMPSPFPPARRRCHLPGQDQYAADGQWRHAAWLLWPRRKPL